MSHSKYEKPLVLDLTPSKTLVRLLIAVHTLTLLALLAPMTLPWFLRGLLAIGVVISLWHYLRLTALQSHPQSIKRLNWQDDTQWVLTLVAGQDVDATLCAECFVTVWLIVLRFDCDDGQRRSVMLVPDRADGDDLRRLRVRLRQMLVQPGDDIPTKG